MTTEPKFFTEYSQGRYLPRTARQVVASLDDTDAVRLAVLLVNKRAITPQEFLGVVRHDPDISVYDAEWVHEDDVDNDDRQAQS